MNPTATASARLIGEIFVENGLITEEQLEQALEEQQTTEQRLGDILIARFGISRVELSSALLEQLADHERQGGAKADRTSGNRDLEAPPPVLPASVSEAIEQSSNSRPDVDDEPASEEQIEQAHPAPLPRRDEGSNGASAARLVSETNDLRAALDRLQARLEDAQSSADERLDEVELRLVDVVTPSQLNDRVHSLTNGMHELGRLSEELAARLASNANSGIDAVVGEVEKLRAQLVDHGHPELVGVAEHVAELELRLSRAVTSADLDERLEQALAAHVAELGSGLDTLTHSMTQLASSADLRRLRKTVDLLSSVTDGANELAARRLAQLEARTEQGAAAADRLQAALIETAEKSAAEDARLRASLTEVADRAEQRLTQERSELDARLGRELQALEVATAENLTSLRGSIAGLTTHLAEQRRHLEAQARADVTRLDGQYEQQAGRVEEYAAVAAEATRLLEQELQHVETELRGRLERHTDRIDEQRRLLEELRDAGEHALQAATAKLTQRLADVERDAVAATGSLKVDLGQLEEQVAGQAVSSARMLEELRDSGEHSLRAATTRLTQRLADVERDAVAATGSLKAGLGQLGDQIAGQTVVSAQESAAARADLDRLRSRLDDLTRRLDGHEHRTVEDMARAQRELDDVRSGIGALCDRLDADTGTTTRHLDSVRKDFGQLQAQVDQLPGKLDRLAEKSVVEALGERVEKHEEQIAESRAWHHELSTEFGRRLGRLGEEVQSRFSRIESGQQEASDELERAAAALRQEQHQLAAKLREEQERAASSIRGEASERERQTLAGLSENRSSLAETSVELAKLRQELVESDRQRRQGDEWLDARIDETRGEFALALKKAAEGELERRRADDMLGMRIEALRKELVSEADKADKASVAGSEALRDGLAALAEQAEQRSKRTDEEVSAAVDKIERELADVAMRTAANAAASQRDLRVELARTADSHVELSSRVDELSRIQNARLARAEEALGSLGVDELRAQVAALQSQVDRQALQARAQADAAEQLRTAFTEIESNLFERQRTFQAASEELMSTFEALGQTIRKADGQAARSVVADDDGASAHDQTYLAFAPDADNRYTLVECFGERPAVGAMLELAEIGGGTLIVTRVTDSPLPHDGRRCVYLERTS